MIEKSELEEVRDAIRELQTATIERERLSSEALRRVHRWHLDSARNLLHYAALREVDLRPLQVRLTNLGLSSLGRSEARVLDNLDAVEQVLTYLLGLGPPTHPQLPFEPKERQRRLEAKLERNLVELLGKGRETRRARIMVTAPTEASTDAELLEGLLLEGMDLLRINCAKDDPDVWHKMIENLRQAQERTGIACRVSADLGGPKLRTGPIEKSKKIRLNEGDRLLLTRADKPGRPAKTRKGTPRDARIGCSIPTVLSDLQEGERVYFDDGKFAARVIEVHEKGAVLEIYRAPVKGGSLKANKGINLPDTRLSLPSLTTEDREALSFVTQHADIVAQSFIRNDEDVLCLIEELKSKQAEDLGLILKVETPSALSRLPEVLLAGLSHRRVGAMVARGDLAVEVGFERLAEAQEEILWLCEAAHMPVIWATQVLESLAKKGLPSRAEVTDAAMAGRAECVMLNKGDYIVEAVRFLSDVLGRMENHQRKKRAQLRPLAISLRTRGSKAGGAA